MAIDKTQLPPTFTVDFSRRQSTLKAFRKAEVGGLLELIV